MVNAILFDLDGTLVDTAPEIADAVNATLARLGLPAVAEDQVRGWIGDGARVLLARALDQAGAPASAAQTAWDDFALAYAERCGQRSTVHEGARALLTRLRAQGMRLAVLTNKEARFAHCVLAAHDLIEPFDLIVAGDTLPVKKPHPDVVHHALAALGVGADEALLIGDSATDVRTARAAGIAVWLVTHGYPQGPLTGDDAPDGFIPRLDLFQLPAAPRAAIT